MGAYNWIQITASCPSCERDSAIRCQTHTASSYDGDDSGRFHDRTYQLGEVMRWFPASDPRVNSEEKPIFPAGQPEDHEACYSDCTNCGANLCVVIRFQGLTPIQVLHVSLESDWPTGYLK